MLLHLRHPAIPLAAQDLPDARSLQGSAGSGVPLCVPLEGPRPWLLSQPAMIESASSTAIHASHSTSGASFAAMASRATNFERSSSRRQDPWRHRASVQPGAADPALHSPPASGPHQGRFASLRDGLRPPWTRPLRQAPLPSYRVGGSLWPVQHSAEADVRPQELRAAQEPERAYCAAVPAAMTGVNVAAVPGRGRWPGLRSDPRLGRCAADGPLLAMGDRGRPRHCLPRIRARRERLHRRWRLVGRTTTPTLRTRASRDTDDFSRYPRGTSRVRNSQNHPGNHPPQSRCAAKEFAAPSIP